jgi:transposase
VACKRWGCREKKSPLASQADPKERAAFQEKQKTLAREDLIFVDEFGIHLAMTRTYARAPSGERATVSDPFKHGSNVSVLSALGLQGVCAPMTIEGAVNSEVFELYVKHLLVPCLRPGNIVLLDNVKFHYSPRAIEWIEAAGARVVHLPAYSPDLNPIEECISKIKEALRSFKARTKRKLYNALAKALALVTEEDIRGWFEHCGYVFSLK